MVGLVRASRNRAELGTCVRITERPNKELKLTKPGPIGASQLNSSVLRTVAGRRDRTTARQA